MMEGKITLAKKFYNYVINNKIKTIRIFISSILLYFSISFLKLGLDILTMPYFIESIKKVPEQYQFLLFAGFIYFFIRLTMLLFDHGYNEFLDIFEEDDGRKE